MNSEPASDALPLRHIPFVTYFTTGLMIVFFLIVFDTPFPGPNDYAGVAQVLAAQAIWRGEAWLLLIAPLLHASLLHLFCCVAAFWIIGQLVERVLGHQFMFGLVFFGALFTSGVQLLGAPWPSLGASPLVFALFGTALAARCARPEFRIALTLPPLNRFWIWLLGFSLLGFADSPTMLPIRGVGNAAQAAGYIFGGAVGWLACGGRRRAAAYGIFGLLAAVTVSATAWMPWRTDWQIAQYYQHVRHGKYSAAIAILEKLDRSDPEVLNALAWTKATARDEKVLDGPAAINLARQALNMLAWKDPSVIDTLAAAYAQAGQWELALATQKIAVAAQRRLEGLELSSLEFTRQLEENLKTIEKRQPVRY